MNVVNALLRRAPLQEYDANPAPVPPEILFKIFTTLSTNDCVNVQRVCWAFRKIVDITLVSRAHYYGFCSETVSCQFLQSIAKMVTFLKAKTCLYCELDLIRGIERTETSYLFFTRNLLQFDFDLAVRRIKSEITFQTLSSVTRM